MGTKAEAPITPLENWPRREDSMYEDYRTPAIGCHGPAFHLLGHSQEFGPDMVRVAGMRPPVGLDHDDMWDFVWSLIGEAAKIGYMVGQIRPERMEETSDEDIARAIAALSRTKLVEDDEPFEPEWHEKRLAELRVRYPNPNVVAASA